LDAEDNYNLLLHRSTRMIGVSTSPGLITLTRILRFKATVHERANDRIAALVAPVNTQSETLAHNIAITNSSFFFIRHVKRSPIGIALAAASAFYIRVLHCLYLCNIGTPENRTSSNRLPS
jgi:hypothetical protein